MLFWNKICGVILIILLASLTCKAQLVDSANISTTKTEKHRLSNPLTLANNTEDKKNLSPFVVIPQDYYTQHFGIMCKKELAIEKATKIPFRFRLGSLQQCNYLEGKK